MVMEGDRESKFNKYIETRLKNLYADRVSNVEYYYQTTKQLDQALLIVSTGALSINMGFVGEYDLDTSLVWALLTAWSLLVVTIISTVISMYGSIKASMITINMIDDAIRNVTENGNNLDNSKSSWKTTVKICNMVSAISFCISWPFLGIFIGRSIWGG
jgi:hypothetical protein